MQPAYRRSPLLILHVSGQSLAQSRHVPLLAAYARHAVVVHVEPEVSCTRGAHQRFRLSVAEIARALADGRPGTIRTVALPGRVPGNRVARVAAWNRWLGLRTLLREVHGRIPGLVAVATCSFPTLLPTLRGLGADVAVYEARDDYVALRAGEHGPREASRIEQAQRRILGGADLAWAVSAPLVERLRKVRADVIETSNGVDFTAFTAEPVPMEQPALEGIAHPRIGLVGNLNDRVNWDWLATLARERPALQVVVVGPIYMAGRATEDGVERLRRHPNVHMLPAVPAEQIPRVVHAFDVGLIPYRLSDVTEAVNPLKAYQYLAAGKPVVASRIPALTRLADIIQLCDDEHTFIAAIDQALASTDAVSRERRRARALENSWERVADARIAAALRFFATR